MGKKKQNWTALVGLSAGLAGGVIATVVYLSIRAHQESGIRLRDAEDIMLQCREKIQEIESGLQTLREPLNA